MYDNPVPPSTSTAPGVVRTVVPLAVGGIVSGALALGVDLGPDAETVLAPAVALLVGGFYYWAVRKIAKRFPWVEHLLGVARVPVFHEATTRSVVDPVTGDVVLAYVITNVPGRSKLG
jgi:hypothetical protein